MEKLICRGTSGLGLTAASFKIFATPKKIFEGEVQIKPPSIKAFAPEVEVDPSAYSSRPNSKYAKIFALQN